jgi:hypothetical protein
VARLRDAASIAEVKSREKNLVISGLPISKAHAIDDLRAFMVNNLHLPDDVSTNHLVSASVNVIRELNTADHKALAIITLKSVTARNALLACGKHLKNTRIFMSADLPKDVQTAQKSLRPFFLAARASGLRAFFVGSHLQIGRDVYSVTDHNKLHDRFPHANARPMLNP